MPSFLGKELTDAPHIQRARTIRVADLMSVDVVTVPVGTPLPAVADLLTKHRFSGLPVVDPDGKLVGIVTEADLLSALNVKGYPVVNRIFDAIIGKGRTKRGMGTVVDDIMTPKPVCIREFDRVQTAVELMDNNHIKRLIVVDEDAQVKCLVARADLMQLFRGTPVR